MEEAWRDMWGALLAEWQNVVEDKTLGRRGIERASYCCGSALFWEGGCHSQLLRTATATETGRGLDGPVLGGAVCCLL